MGRKMSTGKIDGMRLIKMERSKSRTGNVREGGGWVETECRSVERRRRDRQEYTPLSRQHSMSTNTNTVSKLRSFIIQLHCQESRKGQYTS